MSCGSGGPPSWSTSGSRCNPILHSSVRHSNSREGNYYFPSNKNSFIVYLSKIIVQMFAFSNRRTFLHSIVTEADGGRSGRAKRWRIQESFFDFDVQLLVFAKKNFLLQYALLSAWINFFDSYLFKKRSLCYWLRSS